MDIFIGRRQATPKYLAERITMEVLNAMSTATIPPKEFYFEQHVVSRLKIVAYQDPDKVADGLSFIWNEPSKWYRIAGAIGAEEHFVRTTLRLIVNRRNSIVHEADMDLATGRKQPITKSEIESIRGVNCDYAVQKLLEKDLVVIAGRNEEAVGKPLIYATSKSFMDYFGINSTDDLPKINEVLMDEMVKATIVNNVASPGDEAEDDSNIVLAVTENGEIVENVVELTNDSADENVTEINNEAPIVDVDPILLVEGGDDSVDVVAKEEIAADKEEPTQEDAAEQEAGTGDGHIAKDKQVKNEDEATES